MNGWGYCRATPHRRSQRSGFACGLLAASHAVPSCYVNGRNDGGAAHSSRLAAHARRGKLCCSAGVQSCGPRAAAAHPAIRLSQSIAFWVPRRVQGAQLSPVSK